MNAVSFDGALRPAHRHRPPDRRAARVRRRAGARLAVRPRRRGRRRRRARRRSRRVGIRNGPSYTQLRLGSGRAGGDGGRRAPRRRARRGALRVGDRRRPERARGRPRRSGSRRVTPCTSTSRGRASESGSVGGAAVVFLVPPAGTARGGRGRCARPRRCPGVEWVRVYRRPGHVFGPLRRGADRAGAVLATGARPRRGAGAGAPCGGRRTLPGRCEPVVTRRSASSRPRSARRRSPPSPRPSARAG